MEYYAFYSVAEVFHNHKIPFSAAMNAKIHFDNQDVHELDVCFLPLGKQPFIIECKSGEFRGELEKYIKLKKRLGLESQRVIICNPTLGTQHASSLSSMYPLTFVGMEQLPEYCSSLL